MKKTVLVLVTLVMLLTLAIGLSLSVSAEETIVGGTWGNLTWELNRTTGELVISGEGEMNGFYANFSTDAWMPYSLDITRVVIKDGVTSIGQYAFDHCSSLEKVEFQGGVTYIGQYAFNHCSSLKKIELPDTVSKIGHGAFWNCDSLVEMEIPDSVTWMGSSVFSGCNSLKSVAIPDGVVAIENSMFYMCDSLTSVIIPNTVTSIGRSAFEGCKSLKCIDIPNSVTTIWNRAFSDCSLLTTINIPNGVTTIADSTFSLCSSLTNILIPNSVTSIEYGAFTGCPLTSINIPAGVTKIGEAAFNSCDLLKNVTIPNSVAYIGAHAFQNCFSLTEIDLPDNLTWIGAGVFNGCISLTSIEIPSGITSIQSSLFRDCRSLASVYIPDSVTYIGSNAFMNCISLANIDIPDRVTTIEQYTFYNTALTSICIPNGVLKIGARAFYGCASLTHVCLPDGVSEIGSEAFLGCTSLTNITIPSTVTIIGGGAFRYCYSLTDVIIPKGLMYIGYEAFSYCTLLKCITIPDTVISIGNRAFTVIDLIYLNSAVISRDENNVGGLSARTLAIRSDIAESDVGSYILDNFTNRSTTIVIDDEGNVITYRVYSKHSHADDSNVWTEVDGVYICSQCGLNKHTHVTGEWIDRKEPTCEQDGHVGHYLCQTCGAWLDADKKEIAQGVLASPGHSMGGWVQTLAPTCTEDGENRRDCGKCDYYETQPINPPGHKESAWIIDIPVTCTEPGHEQIICLVCQIVLKENIIDPLDHKKVYHEAKQQTCTKPGWDEYWTCERCPWTTYKEISPDGHDLGEWYVIKENTCTKTGTMCSDCANCSYSEIYTTLALGHDPVSHPAQNPTCTEEGWMAYETCARQGCTHTTKQVIPPGGHKYQKTVYAPNCQTGEDGYTRHTCVNGTCGDTFDSDFVKPSHSFGTWRSDSPSCDSIWCEERVCRYCPAVEIRYNEPIPHQYQRNGNQYTCTNCGASYSVDEGGQVIETPDAFEYDCDKKFSFKVRYNGSKAYLEKNIKIFNAYYASSKDVADIPSSAFCTFKVEGKNGEWTISPLNEYEPGRTYIAKLPEDVIFSDYSGRALRFKIKLEEKDYITENDDLSGSVKFNGDVIFVPKTYQVTGTKVEEDGAYTYITLTDILLADGLELRIGDVICFSGAPDLSSLLSANEQNQSVIAESVIGKILAIYHNNDGTYRIKLTMPSAGEIFDKFDTTIRLPMNLDSLQDEDILNMEKDLSAVLGENLSQSEDFAKYLAVIDVSLQDWLKDKGLSIKGGNGQELFNVKVDISRDDTTLYIKIDIVITIPVEKNGTNLGKIKVNTSFYNECSLVFTQVSDFDVQGLFPDVYFDVCIEQKNVTEFSFNISYDYSYSASTSPYVQNIKTGKVHRSNCRYVSYMNESNKKELNSVPDNCSKCLVCNPGAESEEIKDLEKAMLDGLKYSDWGEALLTVKNATEKGALNKLINSIIQKAGASSSSKKGIPLLPIHTYIGFVSVNFDLKLTIDFDFEASLFYSSKQVTTRVYGLARDEKGFHSYSDQTSSCVTEDFRLLGRVSFEAGIYADVNIGLLNLVAIGMDGELGIYARLSGVLGASTNTESGESTQAPEGGNTSGITSIFEHSEYAAAYFESGYYYYGNIYAKVFVFQFNLLSSGRKEVPVVQLGYEKVYYSFTVPDDDPEIEDDAHKLQIENELLEEHINLGDYTIEVRYLDLSSRSSIQAKVEQLALKNVAEHYFIDFLLEDETFCYIRDGKLYLRPSAPNQFEVKVTITVDGRDNWKNGQGGNVLFASEAFKDFTFVLQVTNHKWENTPIEHKDAKCEVPGYDTYKCGSCINHYETVEIPARKHDKDTKEYPATCGESGYKIITCRYEDCEYHLKQITDPPTGHHSNHWIPEGNFEEGKSICIRLICSSCGQVSETRTVSWNSYSAIFIYEKGTDGNYTIVNIDQEAYRLLRDEYNFDLSQLRFPTHYNNKPITKIKSVNVLLLDAPEITSIYIPETITDLGSAFIAEIGKFNNLESLSVSPKNQTYYSKNNCIIERSTKTLIRGINTTIIPFDGSVKIIGSYAFSNCEMEQVVIPSQIKEIEPLAFNRCENLKTVLLFNKLETLHNFTWPAGSAIIIDLSTFSGCENIQTVIFVGTEAEWKAKKWILSDSGYQVVFASACSHQHNLMGAFRYGRYYDVPNSCIDYDLTICYACGSELMRIKVDTHDYVKQNDVRQTCEGYGKENYYRCSICKQEEYTYLPPLWHDWGADITVGATGNQLAYRYHRCDRCKITEVVAEIPAAPYSDGLCYQLNERGDRYLVTGIDSRYFQGDTIMIPPTYRNLPVTEIKYSAFQGNQNIIKVVIPESVTRIGWSAFSGCSQLKDIVLPETLTYIGHRAFYGTAYYNDLNNWEQGVLYIGKYLIEADPNYNGSGTVVMPLSVSGLVNSYVREYEIREQTLLVAAYAFAGCKQYETISMPDSVKYICQNAFDNCYNLRNIKLSSNLIKIGAFAFNNCSSLEEITLPESLQYLEMQAFTGCKNLKLVYICSAAVVVQITNHYQYNSGDILSHAMTVALAPEITNVGERFLQEFTVSEKMSTTKGEYVVYSKHGHEQAEERKIQIYFPCAQDGITWYICDCGLTEVVIQSAHRYGNLKEYKAPTCEKSGQLGHYQCLECHKYFDGDKNVIESIYVKPNGHQYGEWIVLEQPTCVNGREQRHCHECNYIESRIIPGQGHDKIYHKLQPPTCTEKGWLSYETCSRCDYTTYRELSANGHSYEIAITAPTCIGRGYTTHTCHCGDSYVDTYVNALGHQYSDWLVVLPPTCTESGEERRDCERCEYLETRQIKAAGHQYQIIITAPACTQQGYTTYVCNCGESYIDNYVDPQGHKCGDWEMTLPPNCTAAGEERRDCEKCNYFEKREIEAFGHSHEPRLTSPTCTEQGYTTYMCNCGDSYKDTFVDALGHECGEWYESKAPTCTEDGEERRVCDRCDYVEMRKLEAAGHAYEDVVTEPTCTEQGYTTHACHCGESYVDTYVDMVDHTYGEWIIAQQPTCTDVGEERCDCENCDHFQTRELPTVKHADHDSDGACDMCDEQMLSDFMQLIGCSAVMTDASCFALLLSAFAFCIVFKKKKGIK